MLLSFLSIVILAPIYVEGEGRYALSSVKEIIVTDDFLGLDADVRKCQTLEPYDECTTRRHLQRVQEQCNCVPYVLRNFTQTNQVNINY